MATVVFLHAHPDDEAIFTGASMARLAEAGHRVVLVVATGGELGGTSDDPLLSPGGLEPTLLDDRPAVVGPAEATISPAERAEQVEARRDLAEVRRSETQRAAELLGVSRVAWLGFADSGMAGDPANGAPTSLWASGAVAAGRALARVLADEDAAALVGYDARGIYGHPDHLRVHQAAVAASRDLLIPTRYDTTVDREHLHFVSTHLVEEAISGDQGLVRTDLGTATVEITTFVDAQPVLDLKRRAMFAHASQIKADSTARTLQPEHFAEVYGLEWYVREGPPGPLDLLG